MGEKVGAARSRAAHLEAAAAAQRHAQVLGKGVATTHAPPALGPAAAAAAATAALSAAVCAAVCAALGAAIIGAAIIGAAVGAALGVGRHGAQLELRRVAPAALHRPDGRREGEQPRHRRGREDAGAVGRRRNRRGRPRGRPRGCTRGRAAPGAVGGPIEADEDDVAR